MHALKDESYLRQTLQKQAANLHQASISYAVCRGNLIQLSKLLMTFIANLRLIPLMELPLQSRLVIIVRKNW